MIYGSRRVKGLFHHDRLGKVPWAIDVAPAQNCDVIRQQLQRYHFQNRLQQQWYVWHAQHAGSDLLDFAIGVGHD